MSFKEAEGLPKDLMDLISALGYVEILPRKNWWMISFQKEEDPEVRINVYFTKMTVQVQSLHNRRRQEIYKDCTLAKIEEIFTDNN